MKKKLLSGAIAVIIMMAGLSTFAQQDKKAQKARKEIAEAQQDLKEAKIDSAADYEKFVADANMNISENKKAIAALKLKEIKENKADQESYDKKVLALEKENNELEKQVKDSQHTKTNAWQRFKMNFNRSVEKLGTAIKNI